MEEKKTTLEKITNSGVMQNKLFKYGVVPGATAALLGLAYSFFKSKAYDNQTEETKKKYKRIAIDTAAGAAGAVLADSVNPYKERK